MLDPNLINQFRETVNEHGFTFFMYSENNGKNLWNCICSAMDWISVSVDYLHKHPLTSAKNLGSIEMFALISSIDIIVEAIEQLHRVILSTQETIFSKDSECFHDNIFGQNDRIYFKTIRSCFGAHPVNLNEPGDEHNKEAKRFASWSGNFFGKNDFSVILYSNQVHGKDIWFGINFEQLFSFAEKYYNHLNVLNQELENQYATFCANMKKKSFSCEGTAISRLKILKSECESRLNNDYYSCTIDELILIFETPITCSKNNTIVEEYRNALNFLIDEINSNLQEMKITDLKFDKLLNSCPKSLPAGWGYWVGKLTEHVFGNGYPPELWIDRIEKLFADQFQLSYESFQELFVLVQAALYRLSIQDNTL